MNLTIIQSLVWSFPALCLSEKQGTRIMAPVLDAGLSAISICRENTERDRARSQRGKWDVCSKSLQLSRDTKHKIICQPHPR